MMKKMLFFAALLLSVGSCFGQAAYVLPSPSAADQPLTLYIDLNQTTYTGLKDRLIAYPAEVNNVYIWTWQPSGPVNGNGEWGNSNETSKLTWEGGLLFSITFTPTTFYGVDGPTFFARGISCLAKLDNGNAYPDVNSMEAKTEDLSVTIIPKLCDKLYCTFPEIGRADDYLSITYDNNKETNPALQNMGPDDCYIFLYAQYAPFQGVTFAPEASVTSTPALKLKSIGDGKFRITFAPTDFFPGVPAGQTVDNLTYYILRPGFGYAGTGIIPPVQGYTFVNCE